MKYVIKATLFTDSTFDKVVYENQNLSRSQDSFSDAIHILNLDFEIATDEGKKLGFSGTELTIYNEDGTVLQEWVEKVA